MRRIAAALALGAWVGPAAASDLASLLEGRTVAWEFGEQEFYASGRTRDRLLTDSWGWWEVRGDDVCFLWPPAEEWDCATATLDGGALTLAFPDGRKMTGTLE